MGRHIGSPMITTSVRISPEFHKACVDMHISFSEALRIGISLILAEKGLIEYSNDLQIKRKLTQAIQVLNEKCEELENLKKTTSLV